MGLPLAVELAKLQADVPADKPDVVRAIIEKELQRKIDDVFETFEDVPLASASIAQVHRATLPGGRSVVVKVQHPNIADRIRNDLEILAGLAELTEKYVEEAKLYQPRASRRNLNAPYCGNSILAGNSAISNASTKTLKRIRPFAFPSRTPPIRPCACWSWISWKELPWR